MGRAKAEPLTMFISDWAVMGSASEYVIEASAASDCTKCCVKGNVGQKPSSQMPEKSTEPRRNRLVDFLSRP